MATTKSSQRKATDKYIKEKTDEIKIRVPKGKKEKIKAHADSVKESVNAFINRAIDETMENDHATHRENQCSTSSKE